MLVVTLLAVSLSTAQSQAAKFGKGDIDFKAGIGVFPTFAADRTTTIVPPVGIQAGYRLARNFSLAAYAGYSSSESGQMLLPDGNSTRYQNEFLILGLKAAAHANQMGNWDVYGGFLAGYNIPTVSTEITHPEGGEGGPRSPEPDGPSFSRPAENTFTYSGFVGASYFLNKRTGVFAELGYGISILNLGVHFRL